jgi:hypothetical protein
MQDARSNPANAGRSSPGGLQSLVISAAAFFLPLAYPVLGMLWHHEYSVFSPEVALIFAGCIAAAAALAFLVQFTRTLVRNLLLSAVLTIVFMIHFNLFFAGMAITLLASLAAGLVLKDRYAEFIAVVVAALTIGLWLDYRLEPATKLTELKPSAESVRAGPIVHILMDGFMAPDGLPPDERSQALRADVISFFEGYGFELHTRAYSHYNSTLDSMTRALNFRNDDANLFQRATILREPLAFPDNEWFEILDTMGYPINVYQSEAVDFCGVSAVQGIRCNVFPIPNLNTVRGNVPDAGTRVEVLLRTLASQSWILTKVLRDARILDTWGVSVYDERLLPRMARDVRMRPADAFFAHVLIPHSPFVYREDCSIDYEGPSGLRWAYFGGPVGNSARSLEQRYRKRTAQSRCALEQLGRLFDEMQAGEVFRGATIIVHGDHGGSVHVNVPSVHYRDRIGRRDLLEAFSTLFAVKWPGGEHKVVSEVASLNVLMARTASRIAGKGAGGPGMAVDSESAPFVYLTDVEPLRRLDVNIFEEPAQSRRQQ